eukprot:2449190-Ditylum_brightwellii.AAC.1
MLMQCSVQDVSSPIQEFCEFKMEAHRIPCFNQMHYYLYLCVGSDLPSTTKYTKPNQPSKLNSRKNNVSMSYIIGQWPMANGSTQIQVIDFEASFALASCLKTSDSYLSLQKLKPCYFSLDVSNAFQTNIESNPSD